MRILVRIVNTLDKTRSACSHLSNQKENGHEEIMCEKIFGWESNLRKHKETFLE